MKCTRGLSRLTAAVYLSSSKLWDGFAVVGIIYSFSVNVLV